MTQRTCNELGLCQRRPGKPACPDCEEVTECELGVPMAEAPRPTYPFAPGVIQGPHWKPGGFTESDERYGLTALQTGQLVVVILLLAVVVGYVVGVRT